MCLTLRQHIPFVMTCETYCMWGGRCRWTQHDCDIINRCLTVTDVTAERPNHQSASLTLHISAVLITSLGLCAQSCLHKAIQTTYYKLMKKNCNSMQLKGCFECFRSSAFIFLLWFEDTFYAWGLLVNVATGRSFGCQSLERDNPTWPKNCAENYLMW